LKRKRARFFKQGLMIIIAAVVTVCVLGGPALASAPKIERMSFVEAPVGYILQSLGRMYGFNFSISSGAAAKKVSIELNSVTFEDALNMICEASGVKVTESGSNLFIVRSKEEDNSLVPEAEREDKRKEEKMTSSVMEVVSVKYVSVADIESTIKNTFVGEESSLVKISKVESEDTRSYNNLVITAVNRNILDTVKKVISTIDKPRPMVEIEVLFVELIRSNDSSTGIDWNLSTAPFKWEEGASGGAGGAGGEEGDEPSGGTDSTFEPFRFGTFYRLTPWQAEAVLSAIQGNSKSRVLADPKIRVMSGRKALFASETQVPILSRNSDGDVNTEWKNVGINLEILPVVLDDGSIHLQTVPRASSITGEKRLGDVVAPVISERKAETEVLMHPGETMVIGGLMNDKEVRSLSKVPLLSDIPLLGALFKSERKENEKSTVVIFLRPNLVKDTLATKEIHHMEWDDQEKKVTEVFQLPSQSEPGKRPSAPGTLTIDERIEILRKEVEETDRKKAEIEAGLKKKRDEPVVRRKEPVVKDRPKQSFQAPSIKEEPEKQPLKGPEPEAPAEPSGENVRDPKWKQVGDVDEYLRKLLAEYSGSKASPPSVETNGMKKESLEKEKTVGAEAADDGEKELKPQEKKDWTPPMQ